jgi:hypothetical protein
MIFEKDCAARAGGAASAAAVIALRERNARLLIMNMFSSARHLELGQRNAFALSIGVDEGISTYRHSVYMKFKQPTHRSDS